MNACTVNVYTTHEQTEQPITVRNVRALVVVNGLLTVECEVAKEGYGYTAHHRYEADQWTHFEVLQFGGTDE